MGNLDVIYQNLKEIKSYLNIEDYFIPSIIGIKHPQEDVLYFALAVMMDSEGGLFVNICRTHEELCSFLLQVQFERFMGRESFDTIGVRRGLCFHYVSPEELQVEELEPLQKSGVDFDGEAYWPAFYYFVNQGSIRVPLDFEWEYLFEITNFLIEHNRIQVVSKYLQEAHCVIDVEMTEYLNLKTLVFDSVTGQLDRIETRNLNIWKSESFREYYPAKVEPSVVSELDIFRLRKLYINRLVGDIEIHIRKIFPMHYNEEEHIYQHNHVMIVALEDEILGMDEFEELTAENIQQTFLWLWENLDILPKNLVTGGVLRYVTEKNLKTLCELMEIELSVADDIEGENLLLAYCTDDFIVDWIEKNMEQDTDLDS